jgi:DNA-binding response OmpR family regulator
MGDLPTDVFDDFLLKPVNPGQLLDKIAKLLQKESHEEMDPSIEKEVDHLSLHSLNPEIVAEISNVLNPLLMKVESSLIISDVKILAQELITIGQKYQIEYLIAHGKELMVYTECYDIVKMKLTINGIKNTFSRGK